MYSLGANTWIIESTQKVLCIISLRNLTESFSKNSQIGFYDETCVCLCAGLGGSGAVLPRLAWLGAALGRHAGAGNPGGDRKSVV